MKIVQVNHYVAQGYVGRASERIAQITQRMSTQPGFVFRHLGVRKGNPLCLTTITGWQDDASSSAWNEAAKANPMPAAPELYTFVETFEIDTQMPAA